MSSSASTLLKIELQATGENDGTWGTKANTAMSRLEEAIADITNISLAANGGSNYTLDDTQYAEHVDGSNASESHVAVVKATGALNAAEKIIVPLRNKTYWIWNATSNAHAVTVGGSSGGTVTIPQGFIQAVVCDGTNVETLTPATSVAGVLDLSVALGLTATDSNFIVGNGTTFVAESGATVRTSMGLAIGTDVAAYNADTLFADVDDTLTAGFSSTAVADGTKSSGTYTPATAGGNYKTIVGGGAFTLAPQTTVSSIVIQLTNNASAGSITTSGWDIVTGDTISTVNGADFMLYLTVVGAFQHLHVAALQ